MKSRTATVWIVFAAVAIEAVLSVPLLSWDLTFGNQASRGRWIATALALLLCGVIWHWRQAFTESLQHCTPRVQSVSSPVWIVLCFFVGAILRLLWVWWYPAPQHSDQATYFGLAKSLVENHSYTIPKVGLAYWPPGYPFFLASWFLILGVRPWIPVLANLVLFGGTLVLAFTTAARIGGTIAGKFACLLLVGWPAMVMTAGIASKEMLVLFLICLALLVYISSPQARGKAALFRPLLTGVVLGAASLTQPSVQLFPCVLVAYEWLAGRNLLQAARRILVVIVAMAAVILPWTLRNRRVLHAWVPISTNGGDVFYRANNPLATGGFTLNGEQDLYALDEVSRNKIGFRLGVRWIRANPAKFLALGIRKQILFLGDDGQGAFETLRRGLGLGGNQYLAWKGISNLYWWMVWISIVLVLCARWQSFLSQDALFLTLLIAVLYLYGIHSVFESGAKYHEPLMGFLAVIAAQAFACRENDAYIPRSGPFPRREPSATSTRRSD